MAVNPDSGRTSEAFQYFKAAVAANPTYRDALFELAQCYLALKLPDEAIAPVRRSTEVDPDFAQAHFVLGRAFRMPGRSQEANQEQNLCRQIQAEEHAQPTPAK